MVTELEDRLTNCSFRSIGGVCEADESHLGLSIRQLLQLRRDLLTLGTIGLLKEAAKAALAPSSGKYSLLPTEATGFFGCGALRKRDGLM